MIVVWEKNNFVGFLSKKLYKDELKTILMKRPWRTKVKKVEYDNFEGKHMSDRLSNEI